MWLIYSLLYAKITIWHRKHGANSKNLRLSNYHEWLAFQPAIYAKLKVAKKTAQLSCLMRIIAHQAAWSRQTIFFIPMKIWSDMKYQIEPTPKPRMTRSDKWNKRPCVVVYRSFKDKCRALGITLPEQCKIIFHIAVPSSWSKKKKAAHIGQPHLTRPDCDNLVKGLWDALFEEDGHLWRIHAEKRWADSPSIEIIEEII